MLDEGVADPDKPGSGDHLPTHSGVSLAGVSKTFARGVRAVNELDLTVPAGELFVLVGPSGSGKSTTLRLIAGLEDPTEGEITIQGRSTQRLAPHERSVAMVFQDAGLLPHWNVQRQLATAARHGGPADADKRLATTIRHMGLERLGGRMPNELSGGERQRIALARCLLRRPAVLLLDEPLASVEVARRTELRREIQRIHGELAAATIYVTHDSREALSLGQRVGVLVEGRLLQAAAPRDVYRLPAHRQVATLVGAVPMNLLDISTREDTDTRDNIDTREIETSGADERNVWRSGGWSLHAPASAAANRTSPELARRTLGIRPEHIRLTSGEATPPGCWSASGRVAEVLWCGDAAWVVCEPAQAGPAALGIRVAVSPEQMPRVGQRLNLVWEDEQCHWFDGETGKRLADRP